MAGFPGPSPSQHHRPNSHNGIVGVEKASLLLTPHPDELVVELVAVERLQAED
jgi:hypothetical protein